MAVCRIYRQPTIHLDMLLLSLLSLVTAAHRPHIVIIVIDDLGKTAHHKTEIEIYLLLLPGWADVPWNNPHSVAKRLGEYAK